MKSLLLLLLPLVRAMAMPGQRILGGTEAAATDFPYQVCITSRRAALLVNGNFVCSGAVISPTWVLTAAQCVSGAAPGAVQVRVGSNAFFAGGQLVGVAAVAAHPDYDPRTNFNDIAAVRLAAALGLGGTLRAVPPTRTGPGPGRAAVLSGWGQTEETGQLAPRLRAIALTTIATADCATLLSSVASVSTGNVCTVDRYRRGTCKGDAGGPLVSDGVLVGLVSWGVPCARGYPDVFTGVAAYRAWIAQTTGV